MPYFSSLDTRDKCESESETLTIRVLLIEADISSDSQRIRELLSDFSTLTIELSQTNRVASKNVLSLAESIDLVLLDLSLPESQGIETFRKLNDVITDTPVIVLTELDNKAVGLRAIKEGAQDHLVKGKIDAIILENSMVYAIERHHFLSQIKKTSVTDDLTGLYNRKGFFLLSQKQLELAHRAKTAVSLVFMDLDNMKHINDTLGHSYGDRALMTTADLLTNTFRESDVISRLGGDEFAVLCIDPYLDTVLHRLTQNIFTLNSNESQKFTLSISIGTACQVPEKNALLQDLLNIADSQMYKEKLKKHRGVGRPQMWPTPPPSLFFGESPALVFPFTREVRQKGTVELSHG